MVRPLGLSLDNVPSGLTVAVHDAGHVIVVACACSIVSFWWFLLIYSRHGMHVPDHDAAGQFQLSRHTGNVNSSVHFWLRLVLLCTCMF